MHNGVTTDFHVYTKDSIGDMSDTDSYGTTRN